MPGWGPPTPRAGPAKPCSSFKVSDIHQAESSPGVELVVVMQICMHGIGGGEPCACPARPAQPCMQAAEICCASLTTHQQGAAVWSGTRAMRSPIILNT